MSDAAYAAAAFPVVTDGSDETALVAAARGGDRDAFAALVRRHEGAVRRLATGLLADAHEAHDAAQDVFVKAWRKLDGFRGDAAFGTWLHRITVNHCRDLLRARARRPWLSWDALVEAFGGEPPSPAVPPDPAAAGADARDLLRRLLTGIPGAQREVLLLRELNGLSYAEIAATLGCSVESVRARLRRARESALDAARHLDDPGSV